MFASIMKFFGIRMPAGICFRCIAAILDSEKEHCMKCRCCKEE